MEPYVRHIDYKLPQPKEVLCYQNGELPIEVTLESLVVYRDDMKVFSMSLELQKKVEKVKGRKVLVGKVSYKNLPNPNKLLDEEFHLLDEGFLVENCYAATPGVVAIPHGSFEFTAVTFRQDPHLMQKKSQTFENVGHTF